MVWVAWHVLVLPALPVDDVVEVHGAAYVVAEVAPATVPAVDPPLDCGGESPAAVGVSAPCHTMGPLDLCHTVSWCIVVRYDSNPRSRAGRQLCPSGGSGAYSECHDW